MSQQHITAANDDNNSSLLCREAKVMHSHGHATCSFINGLKAQTTEVKDAKVLFYGAGSSAVGVANMIATLLQKEGGLSEKDAKEVPETSPVCHLLFCPYVCIHLCVGVRSYACAAASHTLIRFK